MLAEPIVPSLAAQARMLGGQIIRIDSAALLPADYHYNAGLLHFEYKLHLVYRKQVVPSLNSTLGHCLLDGDFKPTEHIELNLLPHFALDQQFEDPRITKAVNQDGQLVPWLSYTSHQLRQNISLISLLELHPKTFHPVREFKLRYGDNWCVGVFQKNWTFFGHGDKLFCVYKPYPQEVIQIDQATGEQTLVSVPSQADELVKWNYGEIRGGTPPVMVDGHYYSFFHSRLHHPDPERHARYYMGAYCFSGEPPFTPEMVTKTPLLVASEMEPAAPELPYTVFPCGAEIINDEWIVSMGVNDCRVALLKLPHSQLLKRLA